MNKYIFILTFFSHINWDFVVANFGLSHRPPVIFTADRKGIPWLAIPSYI